MESPAPTALGRDRVVRHCEEYIAWYERVKRNTRRADYALQISTIVFSAITPLLILSPGVPLLLQALPATIATVAASLQGVFKFRERYLGLALAAETLKAAKLRFDVRMEALSPAAPDYAAVLSEFAEQVNQIVLDETRDWRRRMAPPRRTPVARDGIRPAP
jgi:hypothetical protein